MANTTSRISTKELAELVNESYSTIDHWAGIDVLDYEIVGRNRTFDRAASVRRCEQIRRLQSEGLPLKLIRDELQKSSR